MGAMPLQHEYDYPESDGQPMAETTVHWKVMVETTQALVPAHEGLGRLDHHLPVNGGFRHRLAVRFRIVVFVLEGHCAHTCRPFSNRLRIRARESSRSNLSRL